MSIEYVEIRNLNTEIIGIIDTAQSIIWHSVYFGVGDFEIYTKATPETVDLLKEDNLVTRPDDIEVGIIESINVVNNESDGLMIVAAGRFAKSILDRRIIYNLKSNSNKATILRGNVETAVLKLISENAIYCVFDTKRNITMLELSEPTGIPAIIVDENGKAAEKQVSYDNLLTYTDKVLEEYGLSSLCVLNLDTNKLKYVIYNGVDRSINNENGYTPVIFSQEFDNLTESEYMYNSTAEKNAALIGGEGEGVARFCTMLAGKETGIQRREMFIDASSISKTYTDENETEQTYTTAQYNAMLKSKGMQDLTALSTIESFTGTIDIVNGNWKYNRDFSLGDIVTVQEKNIGAFVNVRIREITEVQDENGYSLHASYQ